MKSVHMKAPVLSEIYTHKVLHQAHLKKLNQIRQQRKSFIGNKTQTRFQYFDTLKDNKSRSFAHKFNQQSNQINIQNLKILARLQKTKPYFRYTSQDNRQNLSKSRDSHTFVKPYLKKQIFQRQKQNARLTNRMDSISSSLNQKNLLKDFEKSQRIKSRITRYSLDHNKVSLKSEKYISNLSISSLSHRSDKDAQKVKAKSSANYYNRDQIIKNRVENVGRSMMRLKQNTRNPVDQNNQQNKQTFFTQPQKIAYKK